MAARIHKKFNIKLPLTELFNKTTIRKLAAAIEEKTVTTPQKENEKFSAIEPTEKKEYYILSAAQKRLYVLQQMEEGGTAYNMPHIFPLSETSGPEKQEATFKKLIQRHESLRTSFHMIAGTPVQIIHPTVTFKIETLRVEGKESDSHHRTQVKRLQREFFRPFDLSSAPLLRVAILETTGASTKTTKSTGHHHTVPTVHNVHKVHPRYMMIDMHHIITDGISQDILIKEFNALNKDQSLPPPETSIQGVRRVAEQR